MKYFESIPSSVWAENVIPFIDSPLDLLSLRATSKWVHNILHESGEADQIWQHFLRRDFLFIIENNDINDIVHHRKTLRISPTFSYREETIRDNPSTSVFGYPASESVFLADSAFDSWKHWYRAKRRYYGGSTELNKRVMNATYFLRAANMWSKIERWCEQPQNVQLGRKVMNNLNDGMPFITHSQTDSDRLSIFHAFGAIYSFHNGQKMCSTINDVACGLFGGFSFYNTIVCMRMMMQFRSPNIESSRSVRIAYNALPSSCFPGGRVVILDCMNGKVYLCHDRDELDDHGDDNDQRILLCDNSGIDQYDSILLWMENFANILENNEMEFDRLFHDESSSTPLALLHFPSLRCQHQIIQPEGIPVVSCAMTRGIEVIASAILEPLGAGVISYSIRIRLLTPEEPGYMTSAERGFETCQLISRHWIIKDLMTGIEQNVNGNGVVGYYPVLFEGSYRMDCGDSPGNIERGSIIDGTFRYQSCIQPMHGSFRGTIRFVPGCLETPTGNPFFVTLNPFALQLNTLVKY
mmetsp:Transcript_18238/g.21096  ORF Transcript_18238/g.21096 Transcript_18238/m.21096 type:complete len:524 (+) Transcript_18238:60-1631(+)